jgi:hypothetical protein
MERHYAGEVCFGSSISGKIVNGALVSPAGGVSVSGRVKEDGD